METSDRNIHQSYWEIQSFLKGADLTVIGSGIVGLNAAISFKEKHPEARVQVLEKGILPSGASTKNAGFACFGSVSELLDDLTHSSLDDVINLAAKRFKGLRRLRDLLGDENIGLKMQGGMELFRPQDDALFAKCMDHIELFNEAFEELIGPDCFAVDDASISQFGFQGVQHIIRNRFEGQIDTGLMMRSLIDRAQRMGITILTGVNVRGIESGNETVYIHCNEHVFESGSCIVATNGFASKLLDVPVSPARAQVLITKPLKNLGVRGTFHYDAGYYYFRDIHDRILFGGGRNLDPEGETTAEYGLTDPIQRSLETILKEVILPDTDFEIDHRWSGVMGVGKEKAPIIQEVMPNVVCAVRMGGMGVALGSLTGKEAALLL